MWYQNSEGKDFTCDIGEVGISFNFLTAENLSTDGLANGYLLACQTLSGPLPQSGSPARVT